MLVKRAMHAHAEVLPAAGPLVRASVALRIQNLSVAQSLLSKYIGGHACSSWQRSLQQLLWLPPMLPSWMRMWLEESSTLQVSSHWVHMCSHAAIALGSYDEGRHHARKHRVHPIAVELRTLAESNRLSNARIMCGS